MPSRDILLDVLQHNKDSLREKEGINIYKLIPYLLFAGIISITIGGTLILTTTSLSSLVKLLFQYSKLVDWLLAIGIFLVGLSAIWGSVFLKQIKKKQLEIKLNGKQLYSNRKRISLFLNWLKVLDKKLSGWKVVPIIAIGLYLLVKYPIHNLLFAFILLIIAMMIAFMMVMKYENPKDFDEDELKPIQKRKTKLLRLIDYRYQPISISLVLFTSIIIYYSLFNPYGVLHDYESIDTSSRYAISLPQLVQLLIFPIYYSLFLYISHNYNFLGFQKIYVSKNKVIWIYFFEIIVCGPAFLIWIISLIDFIF